MRRLNSLPIKIIGLLKIIQNFLVKQFLTFLRKVVFKAFVLKAFLKNFKWLILCVCRLINKNKLRTEGKN